MKIGAKIDAKQVEKMLEKLRKEFKTAPKGARAGYLAGERHKDKSGKEQPLISDIALFNEYGTADIPPRPFMRNANAKVQKRAPKIVKAGMDDEKDLSLITAEIAEDMRNQIIDSITSNTPPPNAESTIKQKESSKTLIDTGQLMGSVHCAVVQGKKEVEIK